jgi:hypothetical protein
MEENKVATRDKLAEVISRFSENWHTNYHISVAGAKPIASAILQSPDLRVTLEEPRYFLASSSAGSYLRERTSSNGDWNNVAFFYDADKRAAKDVCDWLNSKEPK